MRDLPAMPQLSFWGCVINPGKQPTPLRRTNEDASVVIKQVSSALPGRTASCASLTRVPALDPHLPTGGAGS